MRPLAHLSQRRRLRVLPPLPFLPLLLLVLQPFHCLISRLFPFVLLPLFLLLPLLVLLLPPGPLLLSAVGMASLGPSLLFRSLRGC